MESRLTTVLDIPHLIKAICSQLSLDDIKQCRLVNKCWSESFVPFLWKTLHIIPPKPPGIQWRKFRKMEKTIAQNGQWVRNLRLDYLNCLLDFMPTLTGLWSLRCTPMHVSFFRPRRGWFEHSAVLPTFIRKNKQLRDLTFTGNILRCDWFNGLMFSTFKDHPSLQSLQFDPMGSIEYKELLLFLENCPRSLQSLRLHFEYTCAALIREDKDLIKDTVPAEDRDAPPKEWPLHENLKRLHLFGGMEGIESRVLYPFLKSCPHLTHLGVPDIEKSQVPVLAAFIRNSLPSLDSLAFFSYDNLDASDILTFVRACRGLRSLAVDGFLDEFALPTLPDILQHSGANLEVLKVGSDISLTSKGMRLVLTLCPKLRVFSHVCEEDRPAAGMTLKDFVESEWVCAQLEVLRVFLKDKDEDEDESESEDGSETAGENEVAIVDVEDGGGEGISPIGEASKAGMEEAEVLDAIPVSADKSRLVGQVYAKIGKLTRLQRLDLGWYLEEGESANGPGMQISLEAGLGALSGLKELRTLDLSRIKGLELNYETRAWIYEQWPGLDLVLHEQ